MISSSNTSSFSLSSIFTEMVSSLPATLNVVVVFSIAGYTNQMSTQINVIPSLDAVVSNYSSSYTFNSSLGL